MEAKAVEIDEERKAEAERQVEESKFLADRLAEAEAKLEAEIKGDELNFDDIKFEEGEDGILGKGAFGVVRRATFQGEVVAVKRIKVAASRLFWKEEDAAAVEDFIAEINMMSGLRHQNVIFFYGGVWSEGVKKMCRELWLGGVGGRKKERKKERKERKKRKKEKKEKKERKERKKEKRKKSDKQTKKLTNLPRPQQQSSSSTPGVGRSTGGSDPTSLRGTNMGETSLLTSRGVWPTSTIAPSGR